MKKRIFIYFYLPFIAAFSILLCVNSYAQNNGALEASELRVEYLTNPTGIDIKKPRHSWVVSSDERAQTQSAYQIIAASSINNLNKNQGDLWDSGKVFSSDTNQIDYSGTPLTSRMEVYWKVRTWDKNDRASDWSEVATWSMGLLNFSDWEGVWIGYDVPDLDTNKEDNLILPPSPYLRTEFETKGKVKRATIYASALGLFEMRLNGERVGEDYFTPGWTDYDDRIYYFTYDVTDQINSGKNAMGAILSDGWYAGYVGFGILAPDIEGERDYYGKKAGLLAQLELEYENGETEIISTMSDGQRATHPVISSSSAPPRKIYPINETVWKASTGPLLESDIQMGETYDARLEQDGWDEANFDDSEWDDVRWRPLPDGVLEAYPGVPIREQSVLKPIALTEPDPGTYIFDLGKNFAGMARLKVKGAKGTKIQLRFAEMLHQDGRMMTENLREARAIDTYTLKGEGEEIWQTQFTYHGFQFVEVTGYPSKPDIDMITGVVMNSETPQVGEIKFEGDHNWGGNAPLVTQLFENIKTTPFANFFEVPTDCPQRDERLGWTGDAQVYVRTSAYIADVSAFFTKWMRDLRDAQLPYGAYADFAPMPYSTPYEYAPAWMDAGVIVPYMVFQAYGDTRLLEEHWDSMSRFMEFQRDAAGDSYLRPQGGQNYGDWLAVGHQTDKNFIASAYYGYDIQLMAEMAEALGKKDEARHYNQQFNKVKQAFIKEYVNADGTLNESSQTSYGMALAMNLFPEDLAQQGADNLAKMVRENGNRLATGFAGVRHLLPELSRYGHEELSYSLLMQTEYPSWGYEVVNGATSIWERWNSYTKDEGFMDPEMNSFSHYSYGSVAEWMFADVAGIDTLSPGYERIEIKPMIEAAPCTAISAEHKSIRGMVKSEWNKTGGNVRLSVTVPTNVTAEVYVPATSVDNVSESNTTAKNAKGVKFNRMDGNYAVFEVGGGNYQFLSNAAFD